MDGFDRTIRRQAITLTIGLWVANAGLFMLPALLSDFPMPAPMILGIVTTVALGIPVSAIVFYAAWRLRDAAPWRRYGATLLVAQAMAALIALIDAFKGAWLMHWFSPELGVQDPGFRAIANFAGWAPLFALIAAMYLILIHNAQLTTRARELAEAREAASHAALAAAEAESAATAARLETLRYQLNPHFLFNTLNAISSAVVTGRPDVAEAMLGKLSDFLRGTLTAPRNGMVTIEDELQMLSDYLEIEAARLGERLRVEMHCPPHLREVPLPGFLLQPLVENAIKHGVGATSRTVSVHIDVADAGNAVRLCIADDADARPTSADTAGTGVGLANVRARLAAIYGEDAALDAGHRDGGFVACVTLPRETHRG